MTKAMERAIERLICCNPIVYRLHTERRRNHMKYEAFLTRCTIALAEQNDRLMKQLVDGARSGGSHYDATEGGIQS